MSEDEIAENQVKLMMAGILGPPDGPPPDASPEVQRLYFDVISRVADPKAANGSPLVYQWRFSDADPWHLTIDNGSTRAEPGEAPNPNLVLESSWADWVASGKPDANPLKMILQRRIRPRGSRSASWRGCARSFPERVPGEGGVRLPSGRIQSRPLCGQAPDAAARLWRAIDRLHIAAFGDIRPEGNRTPPTNALRQL